MVYQATSQPGPLPAILSPHCDRLFQGSPVTNEVMVVFASEGRTSIMAMKLTTRLSFGFKKVNKLTLNYNTRFVRNGQQNSE